MYQSRTRPSGRRIIVRGEAGVILFDTDDCHDQANALNAVEWWLAGYIGPSPKEAALFEQGVIPPEDSMHYAMWKKWKTDKAEQEATPVETVVAQPEPDEVSRLYDDGWQGGEGQGAGE